MANWKAYLMVPVVVDIEYANNIGAAIRGAKTLAASYKTVPLETAPGGRLEPKVMAIDGPPEEVAKWAKEMRELLQLSGGKPTVPPIGGGDNGGPSAA